MRKEEIEELIRLVENSSIAELEVWEGKRKIRIAKEFSGSGSSIESIRMNGSRRQRNSPEASLQQANSPEPGSLASNLKQIKSPMVGTFYRSPAPDAEPFIDVGQGVSVGQTVCIVEAMKLMNEIGSDFSGIIRQVYIENAQPVEYGQPLFAVETK